MKQVTYSHFCKVIAEDHGVDINTTFKKYYWEFEGEVGKKRINFWNTGIIVDREGNEFPYMLSPYPPAVRNTEKLKDFDYLYINTLKDLKTILKEADITIESKPCVKDEGGGWTSKGIHYFYKDIYCEV